MATSPAITSGNELIGVTSPCSGSTFPRRCYASSPDWTTHLTKDANVDGRRIASAIPNATRPLLDIGSHLRSARRAFLLTPTSAHLQVASLLRSAMWPQVVDDKRWSACFCGRAVEHAGIPPARRDNRRRRARELDRFNKDVSGIIGPSKQASAHQILQRLRQCGASRTCGCSRCSRITLVRSTEARPIRVGQLKIVGLHLHVGRKCCRRRDHSNGRSPEPPSSSSGLLLCSRPPSPLTRSSQWSQP